MKIACISDTHLQHSFSVPDADLLIHAGDATGRGSLNEIRTFLEWFSGLPHPAKVFCAGNHDHGFERQRAEVARMMAPYLERGRITYLEDSGCEIGGLKIWGSPWQPWFYDWAFNLPRGEALADKWRLIPDDTQILITHGPPRGTLDLVVERHERVGCDDLARRVRELPNLLLHCFGHIHQGYGAIRDGRTVFCNASICDERYRPVNPPRIINIDIDA